MAMGKRPKTTRRNFLHLAGGAAVAGALPVVTLRPADATPAMLSSAIRNVVGEAPVRPGKVTLDLPVRVLPSCFATIFGENKDETIMREAARSCQAATQLLSQLPNFVFKSRPSR